MEFQRRVASVQLGRMQRFSTILECAQLVARAFEPFAYAARRADKDEQLAELT
ncbi:MAG: hypothetical protein V4637_00980 [Pseudomonadota bacterium]